MITHARTHAQTHTGVLVITNLCLCRNRCLLKKTFNVEISVMNELVVIIILTDGDHSTNFRIFISDVFLILG